MMFTPAQIQAIELIATSTGTYEEIATKVGCHVETLRKWRIDKDFCEAVMTRAHEVFRTTLPEIQTKLFEMAKKGDPAALRIFFDHLAALEKIRVNAADCNINFTWNIPEAKIADVKSDTKSPELPTT